MGNGYNPFCFYSILADQRESIYGDVVFPLFDTADVWCQKNAADLHRPAARNVKPIFYDKLHSCYIFLLYRFGLMNFVAGSNYRWF